MVKELRVKTSAGVLDCRAALVEAKGDMELAIVNIRKSGKAAAAKKSSRLAAEGIIVSRVKPGFSLLLEINCETDFVARDNNFLAFADAVADLALQQEVSSIEDLMLEQMGSGTVESRRQDLITTIGENINIRRINLVQGDNLGVYVHAGKIGAIANLAGGTDSTSKDIAMHIVASSPEAIF